MARLKIWRSMVCMSSTVKALSTMHTMERQIFNRAIGLNYMAVLMGIFGVLALCLSAVGVYGVMAYMVADIVSLLGVAMTP